MNKAQAKAYSPKNRIAKHKKPSVFLYFLLLPLYMKLFAYIM